MNLTQKFSNNQILQDNLTSFIQQYGISGLEQALQLYRDTHQSYLCKNRTSISQINIYDIYYLEIHGHNIDVYTEHESYHKYGTLNKELEILFPFGFIKCSQNCIVSLNKIKTIKNSDITLTNSVQLHMSRKYTPLVIIALSQRKTF